MGVDTAKINLQEKYVSCPWVCLLKNYKGYASDRWHGSRRDIAGDTCYDMIVWGDTCYAIMVCSLINMLTASRPYPFGSGKPLFTISFPGWERWWQHKVLRPWHLDSVGWNSTLFEKVPQACRYFVGSDYGFLFIFNWSTYVFFYSSQITLKIITVQSCLICHWSPSQHVGKVET